MTRCSATVEIKTDRRRNLFMRPSDIATGTDSPTASNLGILKAITGMAARAKTVGATPCGMPPYKLDVRSVGPNFGAVGGAGDLRAIVGALLTYGLIVAVLMLVVSATTWALASSSGSWHTAQKAKTGVLVALAGATLTGGALAWANWLLDVGAHL